ncbi:23S rRNA methyltransferase [bacterium]|nr:23S rRNA methyltransferase [bacterium]
MSGKTGSGGKKPGGGSVSKTGGQRYLSTRVKTARGRKTSSTLWLQRQLNDPYVHRAKADGYRSRAAYKLLDLNEKFQLLKPGMRVVDLGAAPGGWTQIACIITRADERDKPSVFAVDRLAIAPMAGAVMMEMDFLSEGAEAAIIREAGGKKVDVVLSDMAPSFTGHAATDHLRTMALAEAALDLAEKILATGGSFVTKMIQGSETQVFVNRLRTRFGKVRHVKPDSSRQESAEHFLVCTGFKG